MIAFADIDGDSDPDLMISEMNEQGNFINKLYLNECVVSSTGNENVYLGFEFSLRPNPASDETVNVSLTTKEECIMNASLFDLNWRLLSQHQERLGMGDTILQLISLHCLKGVILSDWKTDKVLGIKNSWFIKRRREGLKFNCLV